MGGCEVCDLHGAATQCGPLAMRFLLQRLSRLHVRHERSSLQLLQAVPEKQQQAREPMQRQDSELSLLQRRGSRDGEVDVREEIHER